MTKDLINDDPQVIAVRDDGEKQQWGKNHLFFREGGKWTLKGKTVGIGAAVVFAGLLLIQVFVDDSPTSSTSSAKTALLAELSTQTSTLSPERYESTSVTKKSPRGHSVAVGHKFTAPQIVARPRNIPIPPGAMVEGRLVSGASNGFIRAEITETLSQNGETLLEEGTILVGQGTSNEDRLMVGFSQAVLRDGTVASVQAQACDRSDKIVGLKGSKLGNKAVNIIGSIGLGFVGGFSEGLQDTQGQQGVAVRSPSIRNALLNATGATALEQSKNLMSDLKEQRPVIEVPAGEPIYVIFGGGV
jgi:hypothetical protein